MITRDHVTEVSVHEFVTEASDLYDVVPYMNVGWPVTIATDLGNGKPFLRATKKVDRDGDVVYVRYVQIGGCISLKIFND